MSQPPTVSSLDRRDTTEASALLVAAYRDDPLLLSLVPDEPRRRRVAEWVMGPVVGEVMDGGLADGAWVEGRLIALALWMRPRAYPTPSRRRLTEARQRLALGRIVGLGARRLATGLLALDAAHPRGPHWYLWFVGIAAEHRGQGVARRLIEAGLARVDAEQEAAYAETFTERSGSLLERAGFEPAGDLIVGDGLAAGRRMWRPARIR